MLDASKMAQKIVGWTSVRFTETQLKAGERVATPYDNDKIEGDDLLTFLKKRVGYDIEFGPAD